MKIIHLIVPCYNEEEMLKLFYQATIKIINNISNYNFKILFINDGSKDCTADILQELQQKDERICYINLSRNFGKEAAMLAGLDNSKNANAVIVIDVDLQDNPELIPQMIYYWERGFEDVYAKRSNRAGESFLKKFSSKLYYRILQKFTSFDIQVDVGDFRLLDQQCVIAITNMRETQRYTKGLFSWIGFKKKEITFDRQPRTAGKTKWDYFKLFNLALEGITSFTIFPLRLAFIIGVVSSLSAFVYMFFIILKTLLYGDIIQGYPSLVSIILFLGGIQLIVLGIIGEYLGRIFNESKNRPVYFIEKQKNI